MSNQNSIFVIKPYRYNDMWVFDDPSRGLSKEPFVAGADRMIDRATSGIRNAEQGFVLIVSAGDFPDAQIVLEWVRPEGDGNVYRWAEAEMEGWLCPALLKFFDTPPDRLYIEVRPASPVEGWAITADHTVERFPEHLRAASPSLVGAVGPDECMLTAQQIAEHPSANRFRLFHDGDLTLEGFTLGLGGELPVLIPGDTEPWQTICAGKPAVVQLLHDGNWRFGRYLGSPGKEESVDWVRKPLAVQLIRASKAALACLLAEYERGAMDSHGERVLLELFRCLDPLVDPIDAVVAGAHDVLEDVLSDEFPGDDNVSGRARCITPSQACLATSWPH